MQPLGDGGRANGLSGQERRVKVRWKFIVAAERPWHGTVYETRAGNRREEFDGPEEFLCAVARLTGWSQSDA